MAKQISYNALLTCKSKIRYKTRKEAWSWSLYYEKLYGDKSSAYKCRCCNRFHLTKSSITEKPLSIKLPKIKKKILKVFKIEWSNRFLNGKRIEFNYIKRKNWKTAPNSIELQRMIGELNNLPCQTDYILSHTFITKSQHVLVKL